jgi:hypothetical protein
MIGADFKQKGRAAEMRTYVWGEMRRSLNEIVHSGDAQPRPENKFKDPKNLYDPKAQAVINAAEKALQRKTKGGLRVPKWKGPRRRRV